MKTLNVKSKLYIIGVYLLIVILFLLSFNVISNETLSKLTNRYSNATYFDNVNNYIELNSGDTVYQNIKILNESCKSILMYISDSTSEDTITLSDVRLSNINDNTVINIDSNNVLYDNCKISFNLPDNVIPGNYTLSFICNSDFLILSSVNMDNDVSLSINNNYMNECISALCIYSSNLLLPIFLTIICIILPAILMLLIKEFTWKSFLIISVCFCLLFAFVLPYPFSELEINNVYSSCQTINNNIDRYDEFNDSGIWYNSGVFNKSSIIFNKVDNTSLNYSYYKSDDTISTLNIPVINYISSLADRVSSILSLSHYWTVIARRLFNIILYIAICTIAIYVIDKYKILFSMLALSPLLLMNVSTFASFPIVFSFLLLMFAICIRAMFDEDYALKPLTVLLLLLSVFVAGSYSLLILLPFTFIVFCIPSGSCKIIKKSAMLLLYAIIVCGLIAWQTLILVNNTSSLLQVFSLSNINSTSSILSQIANRLYSLFICLFNIYIPFANNSILIALSLCIMVIVFIMSFMLMKQSNTLPKDNKDYERNYKYIILLISIVTMSYIVATSLFNSFESMCMLHNLCCAIISLLSLLITINSCQSAEVKTNSIVDLKLIYLVIMTLSISCLYYLFNQLY